MDRTNHDQAPAFDIVRRLHDQVTTLAVRTGATRPETASDAPLGVWDTLAVTEQATDEILGEDARNRERLTSTADQLRRSIGRADAVLAQIDAHERPSETRSEPETTSDHVGNVAVLADMLAEKLDEIHAATIGRDDQPVPARVLTGSVDSHEGTAAPLR